MTEASRAHCARSKRLRPSSKSARSPAVRLAAVTDAIIAGDHDTGAAAAAASAAAAPESESAPPPPPPPPARDGAEGWAEGSGGRGDGASARAVDPTGGVDGGSSAPLGPALA